MNRVSRSPLLGAPALSSTPLLGRDVDLARLRDLLEKDGARLVTVTGTGGTGKSRLALAVAVEAAPRFGEAAWFVDLAPVRDPRLVPAAVAQALGIQESGSKPLESILQEILGERPSLVVLDNFEQVLDASLFVADLLARCPELVALVTSREPLGLREERVYPLEPLPVPDLTDTQDVRAARQVASVALFEDRARARRPNFSLSEANLRAVAEICVRLDGLPLAIELAAAQVGVLSPDAILQRLASRASFVVTGPRDLPARHQTLQAVVGWGYDLLDATEQAVFRWCGVFDGTFTAEAMQAVRADLDPAADALGTLAALVTKSLVRALDSDEGQPRFGVLETIRDYAREQLRVCGELEEARRRHAHYYLGLAQDLQSALRGTGMAAALETLQAEYDNFRGVFLWSASEGGELSVGLRLAGALYRFWIMRGQLAEARQWLEPALARAGEVEPQVCALALNAGGILAGIQQDHARSIDLFEESLRLWTELGDRGGMAGAHLNLGLVAHDLGDLERALREFVLAEQLYTDLEDKDGLGRALGSQARIAREQGELERAMALFGRCLQLFRDVGDEWSLANSLANLGYVMLALGETASAEDLYRQALHIRRRLGSVLGVAECLEGFAGAFAERQPRRAARLLGAAEALREIAGAPLEAVEQGRYADLVARVRAQLREDLFAAAWAAGRSASMEEAIALALRSETAPVEAPAKTPAEQPAPTPVLPTDAAEILTRREREIAELIAAGRSNREIATILVVAVRTVETHVEHIFRKLGVQTRAEVAVWAAQHGLLPARR